MTGLLTVLLLLATSPLVAQSAADGYSDFVPEVQTTNSPAGTAVEPGSQLLYLLDTGIAAGAEFGADPDFAVLPIVELSAGQLTGARWQNFISITNSNPTDAVTVHFRYFNQWCEDVLDFLVVLTCNGTMLTDPFNYDIPATTFNTSQRIFGDAVAQPANFAPLPGNGFGDGRFLLFVTASGDAGNESREEGGNDTGLDGVLDYDDDEDLDNFADWLFPNELIPDEEAALLAWLADCPAVDAGTIGFEEGISDHNLNIFNSTAISFNFLTGFHTVGVPVGNQQAAFGVRAWVRPAVVAAVDDGDPGSDAIMVPSVDVDASGVVDDFDDTAAVLDGGLDGDGPLAPKRSLLSGTESIWLTLVRDSRYMLPANQFYLRQDAHGGDTIVTNCEGTTANQAVRCGVDSNPYNPAPNIGGAMSWTLFPVAGAGAGIPPEDQFVYPLSVKDDYNGSNNPNNAGIGNQISDNSYRMDTAATYYDLSVYNNDEDLLSVPRVTAPISPPPPFTPISVVMCVTCLNSHRWEFQTIKDSDQVSGGEVTDFVAVETLQTFSVDDLFSLDGQNAVLNHLAVPVSVNDELGPGWIRFDRIVTRDFFYDVDKAGFTVAQPYDGARGTYVVIAKSIILFEGFGVSWYLPLSATNSDLNSYRGKF